MYFVLPLVGEVSIELPPGFWVAWGTIVTGYVVGRSAEKSGFRNKVVEALAGKLPEDEILKEIGVGE